MPEEVETLPPDMAAADDELLRGVDEAPEPETPAAVEPEPASPEPQTTDTPRDEKGRFTEKAPPAPEATPTPGPSPSAALPSEPVAPETPVVPYKYTGDGQEVVIPGSQVGEDGIYIPAAEVPRITRLLSQGHAWDGSAQRYIQETQKRTQGLERQVEAATEGKGAVEAQLNQILGTLEKLIEDSIGVPDEQLFQTSLGQWLLDRRTNWGILKAESKAARIEREREADRKELTRIQTERQEAELRPQMDRTLSDGILHFGGLEKLDRQDMEDIYATLRSPEYESLVFIRAPQDDPLNHIKKGELVINYAVVEREAKRVATLRSRYKPNGQVQAQPPAPAPAAPVRKPVVPPTVSATRGPAPKAGKPPAPKTREEADKWLLEGEPE